MHICADEIMAFTAAVTAALPFFPRVRAYLKRRFAKATA